LFARELCDDPGVISARSEAAATGTQIGDYAVGAKLGEGATGTVYRATRAADELEVALKVMRRSLTGDETYRTRFRREARVAAEVQHPNLVPVIEFGESDRLMFIASKFKDGGSLADLIERDGRLPLRDCARLGAEIAAGLEALHEHGIVHRDVKPSNVMLDRTGVASLTDFGLARGEGHTVVTKTGAILGTLDYLAPELIEGKAATAESDVYAFGCLMYECVTGAAPFSDRAMFELAVAHLEEDPADPRDRRDGLSEEFAWSLLRALKKDPARRPPTPRSYARLLSDALT
jgi:serine/threonine protein kinase